MNKTRSIKFHIHNNVMLLDEKLMLKTGGTINIINERMENGVLVVDDVIVIEDSMQTEEFCPVCYGKGYVTTGRTTFLFCANCDGKVTTTGR